MSDYFSSRGDHIYIFFCLLVWNHILTWQGRPMHRPSPFCVAYVGELFTVQHTPCNEVSASRLNEEVSTWRRDPLCTVNGKRLHGIASRMHRPAGLEPTRFDLDPSRAQCSSVANQQAFLPSWELKPTTDVCGTRTCASADIVETELQALDN